MSQAPMASPTGCQATMMREMARTLLVSAKLDTPAGAGQGWVVANGLRLLGLLLGLLGLLGLFEKGLTRFESWSHVRGAA